MVVTMPASLSLNDFYANISFTAQLGSATGRTGSYSLGGQIDTLVAVSVLAMINILSDLHTIRMRVESLPVTSIPMISIRICLVQVTFNVQSTTLCSLNIQQVLGLQLTTNTADLASD
jgi:hypothetical protein